MSDLVREIDALRAEALSAVEAAEDVEVLRQLEVRYLGRRSRLTAILRTLRDLSEDERRLVGAAANRLRSDLETAVSGRRRQLEERMEAALLAADSLDLTMAGRRPPRGAPNPIVELIRRVEDAFIGIGYEITEGREVEDDWHNFEALNTPPGHPARSLMDTFYVEGPNGPESALLRTHTSPVQVRVMESRRPPIYVICPGRVFRREDVSMTSSAIFYQIEGLAVDEDLTFKDLKGTVGIFAEAAFGEGVSWRLVPSFYPFTEPSCELQVTCPVCGGQGCPHCAAGWIGAGGCGMVDPNVFEFVGIDPERYTGFAFGMGVDRTAMRRFGISDMRLFLEGDLRFLEQFRGLPVR